MNDLALFPFDSQTCKILFRSNDEVRYRTNTGLSPLWVIFVGIAYMQHHVPPWVVICLVGVLSTFRTHVTLSARTKVMAVERRILGIPFATTTIRLDDIVEVKVSSQIQPEGQMKYRLILAVQTKEGKTVERRITRRPKREQLDLLIRSIDRFRFENRERSAGH
jgi:hypothetical protein